MSVDDAPDEGFVRGASFLQPTLHVAFDMPRDFKLFNDHDGVLGVGRDRSVMLFSCKSGSVPGRLDDWMRNELKPTPTDIQETDIGGAEAAIGARPRGADTGLGQIRYVIIRHEGGICYFNFLAEGPDKDRRIERWWARREAPHSLDGRGGGAPALSPAGGPDGRQLARNARGTFPLR